MNEEQIIKVAKVLEERNPPGEKANTIDQLDGYPYEVIDILASIKIVNGTDKVKKIN